MKFDMAKVVHSMCEKQTKKKNHQLAVVSVNTQVVNILLRKSNHVNESSYDDVKERSRVHDTIPTSKQVASKDFMNEMLDFALHNPTSSSSLESLPSFATTTTIIDIITVIIIIVVLLSSTPPLLRLPLSSPSHAKCSTPWIAELLIQRKNSPIAHTYKHHYTPYPKS